MNVSSKYSLLRKKTKHNFYPQKSLDNSFLGTSSATIAVWVYMIFELKLTFSFKKDPPHTFRLDVFETGNVTAALELSVLCLHFCLFFHHFLLRICLSTWWEPTGGENCRSIPWSKTSSETYRNYIWFILDICGCNYRDKIIEAMGQWVACFRGESCLTLTVRKFQGVLERCELFCWWKNHQIDQHMIQV